MFNRKEYKLNAKEQVKNIIGPFLFFMLIGSVLGVLYEMIVVGTASFIGPRPSVPTFTAAASGLTGAGIIVALLEMVFSLSAPYFTTKTMLINADTKDKVTLSSLFKVASWSEFLEFFFNQLIVGLILIGIILGFTILGSCFGGLFSNGTGSALPLVIMTLFYFTGLVVTIWVSFQYVLVPFLAIDQSELGISDTLKLSKATMDGHKWEWFVMGLSFFLWCLLIVVTFGLAAFYVSPYMSLSFAYAYRDLIGHDITEKDSQPETCSSEKDPEETPEKIIAESVVPSTVRSDDKKDPE
jgi:uncharacterized membrane protein